MPTLPVSPSQLVLLRGSMQAGPSMRQALELLEELGPCLCLGDPAASVPR